MVEELKRVTVIKASEPMPLSIGGLACYYWIGEEWYERLKVLFGDEFASLKNILARLGGLEMSNRDLYQKWMEARNSLIEIQKPIARDIIIHHLKENPDVRCRDVLNTIQDPNMRAAFYHAWEALEKEGAIVGVSQGSGRPKRYRLSL